MDVFEGDYISADSEWDELAWVWRQTDVPKGCKVEIIDGLITVTPYSACAHHGIVERVQRYLYEVIPEEWGIYQRLATAVPSRLGLYVPDLAVVPKDALRTGDDHFVPAAASQLAVEVTSKATANNDRTTKAAGYAESGVPLYLLIDPLASGGPKITLYGEPKNGVYRVLRTGKFGDPVILPPPFHITLDTGEFRGS
ncbi:Uma2 family endonuclease [Streptomyces cyaneochromogenes]|uniref:Uma2 family endonuclease n=1 Tax=Streptomyces cyaneochromogenes TaxID=2496836 RepID=A0A3Q9F0V3_9ACTN|nr:Uma2 family endonuclease [Streptomyces cyaneochromogenes]AZQ40657.1 Uma2 family endonuclease [Streptomyces cyaneochromogenes]